MNQRATREKRRVKHLNLQMMMKPLHSTTVDLKQGLHSILDSDRKIAVSFVNDLPRLVMHGFHTDAQAARIVKFFVCLEDVKEGSGPFCYVFGSMRGWRLSGRN